MTATIPLKDRPEWEKMVTGELNHNYKNYVLQTKTFQMQKEISTGSLTKDKAIDELYELCLKYSLAVQSDFKIIFKNW